MSLTRSFLVVFLTSCAIVSARHAQSSALCEPAPRDLIGWWPGDGNSEDIARNNDGTISGVVTFEPGKIDSAFKTKSSGGHVNIAHAPELFFGNDEAFTASAWFKATSEAEAFIFLKNAAYGIKWQGTTRPLAFYNGNYHFSSTTAWELDRWYHVAIVDDGVSSVKLYVDGVLNAIDEGALRNPNRFAAKLSTGYIVPLQILGWFEPDSKNEGLTGEVDELMIFRRALNGSEIQTIFQTGERGLCKDAISVQANVKLIDAPNCLEPIPVVILGSESLDVSLIRRRSLTFEGQPIQYRKDQTPNCKTSDVNADGWLDLTCRYRNGSITGTVAGTLFNGAPIEGMDSFCISN